MQNGGYVALVLATLWFTVQHRKAITKALTKASMITRVCTLDDINRWAWLK